MPHWHVFPDETHRLGFTAGTHTYRPPTPGMHQPLPPPWMTQPWTHPSPETQSLTRSVCSLIRPFTHPDTISALEVPVATWALPSCLDMATPRGLTGQLPTGRFLDLS